MTGIFQNLLLQGSLRETFNHRVSRVSIAILPVSVLRNTYIYRF